MGRIQGLTESGLLNEDKLLKTGKGYVFHMTLSWKGLAAGQQINLRDGLDGVAPVEVPIVLDSANNTRTFDWPQGKEFDTGIFFDNQGAGGNVYAEITYK